MEKYGLIPDAVPRYNEERGFFLVRAIGVNWHHIRGVLVSILADGEDPHRPENVVPLSARTHTGKGILLTELDGDETVIHLSAMEAFRAWSRYRQGGADDPFVEMKREGLKLARQGLTRHFGGWDEYFRQLAEEVTRNFRRGHPDDTWPETKWG